MADDNRVFAYIDGEPTKGAWVELDEDSDDSTILDALRDGGVFDGYAQELIDEHASEHKNDYAEANDGGVDPEYAPLNLDDARIEAAEAYGGDILIADSEGIVKNFVRHGVLDMSDFVKWAQFMYDNERYSVEVIQAYFNWTGTGESTSHFEEAFSGTFDSKADWAEEYMDSCYTIPESLVGYIDYEKFARDCELGGDIDFEDLPNGEVVAFRNV